MEIKSAQEHSPDKRMKVMETIIIDGRQYNCGTVLSICGRLNMSSSMCTTRITPDAAVRQLLLTKEVIMPTPAYPPDHCLCRFARGQAFVAFFGALMEAKQQLEEREPLNNSEPNSFLKYLDGQSWGIDPAPDALGPPEDILFSLRVNDFDEDAMTSVCLLMDTDDESPYFIDMAPDVAIQCGELLYDLARPLVDEKPIAAPSSFRVQTESEVIQFSVNQERRELLLTGEGWEDEENGGLAMTPAQADEIAWQLREYGAMVLQKTCGKPV